MNDLLKQAVSLSLLEKCIAAVVGVFVIHATFRLLEQILPRRFGRPTWIESSKGVFTFIFPSICLLGGQLCPLDIITVQLVTIIEFKQPDRIHRVRRTP